LIDGINNLFKHVIRLIKLRSKQMVISLPKVSNFKQLKLIIGKYSMFSMLLLPKYSYWSF